MVTYRWLEMNRKSHGWLLAVASDNTPEFSSDANVDVGTSEKTRRTMYPFKPPELRLSYFESRPFVGRIAELAWSDRILVLLIGDYKLKQAKTDPRVGARNNLPLTMRVSIHHKSSNSFDGSGLSTGSSVAMVKICPERMTNFLQWR